MRAEVAREAALAGGAKGAAHRASNLTADTDREALVRSVCKCRRTRGEQRQGAAPHAGQGAAPHAGAPDAAHRRMGCRPSPRRARRSGARAAWRCRQARRRRRARWSAPVAHYVPQVTSATHAAALTNRPSSLPGATCCTAARAAAARETLADQPQSRAPRAPPRSSPTKTAAALLQPRRVSHPTRRRPAPRLRPARP